MLTLRCCCRCLALFASSALIHHALQGSERSTSTRENFHLEGFRSDEGGATYRNTPNEPGRYYAARGEEARAREHDRRCSRRQAGDAKVDGSGRDRSRSVEDAYDVDVEDVDVGVGGWEGGDLGPASSPLRRRAGGIRRSTPNNGSGRERPMPSYALPTKHFKTTSERWGKKGCTHQKETPVRSYFYL